MCVQAEGEFSEATFSKLADKAARWGTERENANYILEKKTLKGQPFNTSGLINAGKRMCAGTTDPSRPCQDWNLSRDCLFLYYKYVFLLVVLANSSSTYVTMKLSQHSS
jgi:hypothetical protein